MTKEECIGKNPIVADKEGTNLYVKRNDALKSMDEWALQFGKWLQGCGYYPHKSYENVWVHNKNREIKTTEGLYQLFIKQ